MKFSSNKWGVSLLSATALVALLPSVAQAAPTPSVYMNPKAGITKLWKTDPAKYGKPLSPEKCVKGKGCEQIFEKSVITWGSSTGVKALTGADRAQAYEKAGGIGGVGALEGDAWNNTYCGPSVTTYDGKTRHLVVVGDTKATAGSSIDLNSVEGKKWLQTRGTTKACFDAKPAADNEAATKAKVLDMVHKSFDSTVTAEDIIVTDGRYYAVAVGYKGRVFLYDQQTGNSGILEGPVYTEYIKNPSHYGGLIISFSPDGGDSDMGYVSIFGESAVNEFTFQAYGERSVSVQRSQYVVNADGTKTWQPVEDYVIDHEVPYTPLDINSIDWSKASYSDMPGLPGEEGGALFVTDARAMYIIKANADHTPVAGAKAYRSEWLGYQESIVVRGSWTQAQQWYQGDWNLEPSKVSALGVPVAEAKIVEEGGLKYQTQQFEHGSIKWLMPDSKLVNPSYEAEITLNPEAQAFFNW